MSEGEKKIGMPLVMRWAKSAPPLFGTWLTDLPKVGGAIDSPDTPVTCVPNPCNKSSWLKSLGLKSSGLKSPRLKLGVLG